MDVRGDVTLDLKEFGYDGQIVLGAPSFRRTNALQNAIVKLVDMKDGKPVLMDTPIGDLNLLTHVAYMKSAPFYTGFDKGVEPLLEFMDKLDEKEIGSAQRFWDAVEKNVGRIIKGDTHPLQ